MIVTLFVVFAVASSALGECPVPPTIPGFDIGKIAGRWYQTVVFPNKTTIIKLDFTLREDGDFNLTTHSPLSKQDEYILAKRTDNQNVLNFTYPDHKVRFQNTFNIADTDYDNYLVAYSCYIFPNHSTIYERMILSRTETMYADKYAELTDLFVNINGVSSDRVAPKIH